MAADGFLLPGPAFASPQCFGLMEASPFPFVDFLPFRILQWAKDSFLLFIPIEYGPVDLGLSLVEADAVNKVGLPV